jgi:hypothetical protein
MTDDALGTMPRVVPMISHEDVASAADWIAEAFGFRETGRWADTDGPVTQVNMELGDGMIMLGSPSTEYQSPATTPRPVISPEPGQPRLCCRWCTRVRGRHRSALQAGASVRRHPPVPA